MAQESLADVTRQVSDTAAELPGDGGSAELSEPAHTASEEQLCSAPALFQGRKVICKSAIPRTAQCQMVLSMPAAS